MKLSAFASSSSSTTPYSSTPNNNHNHNEEPPPHTPSSLISRSRHQPGAVAVVVTHNSSSNKLNRAGNDDDDGGSNNAAGEVAVADVGASSSFNDGPCHDDDDDDEDGASSSPVVVVEEEDPYYSIIPPPSSSAAAAVAAVVEDDDDTICSLTGQRVTRPTRPPHANANAGMVHIRENVADIVHRIANAHQDNNAAEQDNTATPVSSGVDQIVARIISRNNAEDSTTNNTANDAVLPDGPAYIVIGMDDVEVEKQWYQKRYIQIVCIVALGAVTVTLAIVFGAIQPFSNDASSDSVMVVAVPSLSPSVSSVPSLRPTWTPSLVPTASPSSRPSGKPTDLRSALVKQRLIEAAIIDVDTDVSYSSSSAPGNDDDDDDDAIGMAFAWIVHEDELQMDPADQRIIQRFVLALVYFANGGGTWQYLDEVWLSAAHECEWTVKDSAGYDLGVALCVDDVVTQLDFYNCNLSGTIQTELSRLTDLDALILGRNAISGTLPTSLGSLTKLLNLNVEHNIMSGTIPSEFGRFASVRKLGFQYNDFIGTIPSEFGLLESLEGLYLESNFLTGSLPTAMFNLNLLREYERSYCNALCIVTISTFCYSLSNNYLSL